MIVIPHLHYTRALELARAHRHGWADGLDAIASIPPGGTHILERALSLDLRNARALTDPHRYVITTSMVAFFWDWFQGTDLVAAETYDAGDISAWLTGILISRCGGAALGVALWVPQRRVGDGWETAELLCTELKNRGFGRAWMLPGIPVTDTDQLSRGICNGLIDELRELALEVRDSKPGAPCRGQLDRAAVIADRATALGGVLGTEKLAEIRAAVRKISEAVRAGLSDTAQRALALEF